ncbi:hypothetical protein EVAR_23085_1 [Eumeta japonica]|uniref:Uncharacterized protein n=1 Tax=Eumeta variegata TaxID=151549 RepID=A0A4C1VNM9_EUMVA|nr:hypothetical protein EVAR_23085_1 [Eumeta japonica]
MTGFDIAGRGRARAGPALSYRSAGYAPKSEGNATPDRLGFRIFGSEGAAEGGGGRRRHAVVFCFIKPPP